MGKIAEDAMPKGAGAVGKVRRSKKLVEDGALEKLVESNKSTNQLKEPASIEKLIEDRKNGAELKGLINKPQFDKEVFKLGHPVRLGKVISKFPKGEDFKWRDKFTMGDFGLVQQVGALEISILLVDNKVQRIPVDLVALGAITIEILA